MQGRLFDCALSNAERTSEQKTEAKRRQFAPVGKVFRDVRVAILDPETLVPQPIGVSGEVRICTELFQQKTFFSNRSMSADQLWR